MKNHIKGFELANGLLVYHTFAPIATTDEALIYAGEPSYDTALHLSFEGMTCTLSELWRFIPEGVEEPAKTEKSIWVYGDEHAMRLSMCRPDNMVENSNGGILRVYPSAELLHISLYCLGMRKIVTANELVVALARYREAHRTNKESLMEGLTKRFPPLGSAIAGTVMRRDTPLGGGADDNDLRVEISEVKNRTPFFPEDPTAGRLLETLRGLYKKFSVADINAATRKLYDCDGDIRSKIASDRSGCFPPIPVADELRNTLKGLVAAAEHHEKDIEKLFKDFGGNPSKARAATLAAEMTAMLNDLRQKCSDVIDKGGDLLGDVMR